MKVYPGDILYERVARNGEKMMEMVYPANSVRICIDEIKPDIRGVAYSPLKSKPIAFSDMGRMMLELDELFDETGYPQSYQDKRSFNEEDRNLNKYHGKPAVLLKPSDILVKEGNLATLDVLVETRRNTSWQGKCYGNDHRIIGQFDGDMELMNILTHCIGD